MTTYFSVTPSPLARAREFNPVCYASAGFAAHLAERTLRLEGACRLQRFNLQSQRVYLLNPESCRISHRALTSQLELSAGQRVRLMTELPWGIEPNGKLTCETACVADSLFVRQRLTELGYTALAFRAAYYSVDRIESVENIPMGTYRDTDKSVVEVVDLGTARIAPAQESLLSGPADDSKSAMQKILAAAVLDLSREIA